MLLFPDAERKRKAGWQSLVWIFNTRQAPLHPLVYHIAAVLLRALQQMSTRLIEITVLKIEVSGR